MKKYISSKLHPPSAMQEGAIHMTPAQEKAFKREGIRVVLGGILVHFVLGTFYIWGGISVYVASYLKSFDSSADIDTVKMVFPLMFIGINAMLSLGVKLAAKIGHRIVCFIGVCCIALASLIVSWITNFWLFIIIYTVMIGLASGLVYMVPVVCGWRYFPKKKGVISGAIIAGYGLGSFTFNLIALHIVNPNNEVASVLIDGHKYFTADVYTNVPRMFRIFALMYVLIGTVGCLMVKMPKTFPTEHQEEQNVLVRGSQKNASNKKSAEVHEHQDADTIREGVMTRSFWLLFGMVMCGSFFGLLQANNYKVYGLLRLSDDSFVTLTGSVGSAVNGCSRFLWASLYELIGYKKTYILLMGLQVIMAATLDSVAGTKILFLIWHSCIMATEGGQFSIMPPATTKVFGPKIGPVIYGVLYIGFSIANLTAFFLTKFGTNLSWKTIFWICFALSVAAFAINFLYDENKDIVYKNHPKSHELMRLPGSPTEDHEHDHDHDDHSHDHDHDHDHDMEKH